ncbi:MAG TPA: YdeI/OmpD-associated family protein [Spirochaetia bacterium]|nr:YdeI/OmpD-associated family protein [Spirochaetia bacterium]
MERKAPRDHGIAETLAFRDARAFDAWLARNHHNPNGVWLKLARKSSGVPSLTADEAVDVGLCWGWISGQRRALDQSWYLQKYVPRRPGSAWSQVNVGKVRALTRAGRMQEPGRAEVRAAKADGRWAAAYASQRDAEVPQDLAVALSRNRAAARHFLGLNRTGRYAVIVRLARERSADRRSVLLRKLIARMAEEGSRKG